MSDELEFDAGHGYSDDPWDHHEAVHLDLITREGFYRAMTWKGRPPPIFKVPRFADVAFAAGPPETAAMPCITFELVSANSEVGTALYRER